MATSKSPHRLASDAAKARFFLEHSKVDWAVEALEDAPGSARAELAASCVDAAAMCDAFFERERDFDEWIDAAMALPPKSWALHREPWARALAALSAKEDPLGAAFVEDLLASAPASIHAMEMEGATVRDWLAANLSNRHGDWVQALDALAAIGHQPGAALKSIAEEPYAMSPALESLCSVLYNEMKVSDYNCGESDEIIDRASREDRPPLALSILPTICYRVRDIYEKNKDEEEEEREIYEAFWERCLDEAMKTTPAMRRAMAGDWCASLDGLAQIDSDEARAAFDAMAASLEPAMLDSSRFGQGSWRAQFLLEGGRRGDLVRQAEALSERKALETRDDSESPLKAILAAARAAAPRKPRL